MSSKSAVSGVVLVGGTSRRFAGKDKASLKINSSSAKGQVSLLEITLNKLHAIFREVIISTKSAQRIPHSALRIPAIKVVEDVRPGYSSLVGIYSALAAARYPRAFVLAVDMPLVPPGFIRYLVKTSRGYDVTIPEDANGLEPLCAVYSRKCLPAIKRLLDRGRHKIIDFFPEVRVKRIRLEELKRSDKPQDWALYNVNTPADLKRARSLLSTDY